MARNQINGKTLGIDQQPPHYAVERRARLFGQTRAQGAVEMLCRFRRPDLGMGRSHPPAVCVFQRAKALG